MKWRPDIMQDITITVIQGDLDITCKNQIIVDNEYNSSTEKSSVKVFWRYKMLEVYYLTFFILIVKN